MPEITVHVEQSSVPGKQRRWWLENEQIPEGVICRYANEDELTTIGQVLHVLADGASVEEKAFLRAEMIRVFGGVKFEHIFPPSTQQH